jgi:hypothetical protein
MRLSEVRKAVVATVGAVLTLLVSFTDTFTLLPDNVSNVVAWVVAVGTGVVTYLTRNEVVSVLDR